MVAVFEYKPSQFSIQRSSRMIFILNDTSSRMQVSCVHIVELVFRSLFISHPLLEFLKVLICSNSIYIFSLLWNRSFNYDTWSYIKMERLFIKQTFHELNSGRSICLSEVFIANYSQIKRIRMNHSILKSITEPMFRFLNGLESAYY